MTATSERRVVDAPDRDRFEILQGDEVVGFLQYHRRPGLIALTHTEVGEAHEGEGLGGELVRSVLDRARDERLEVLPFCPFVNGYIKRHREYVDLVPEHHRRQFGL